MRAPLPKKVAGARRGYLKPVSADPDQIHARIAAQIRRRVEAKGMTLRGLAEEMGTGHTHLWSVLGGKCSPTVTWLCRAADVLGCKPIDLMREPRK